MKILSDSMYKLLLKQKAETAKIKNAYEALEIEHEKVLRKLNEIRENNIILSQHIESLEERLKTTKLKALDTIKNDEDKYTVWVCECRIEYEEVSTPDYVLSKYGATESELEEFATNGLVPRTEEGEKARSCRMYTVPLSKIKETQGDALYQRLVQDFQRLKESSAHLRSK